MKTLKEIMVSSPIYCGQHDTLQKAAEEMFKSNIGSVPIVDENKKVVGIVTDRDICLALGQNTTKTIAQIKVKDIIANKKVHTLSANDDVQTALRTMRTKGIRRVPVVDNEQNLKGIVTLSHILRHTHGSKEEAEVEYAGEENVLKTLHTLSNRKEEAIF